MLSLYAPAFVAIIALLVMVEAVRRQWWPVATLFLLALVGYWAGVLFNSQLLVIGGYGALCAGCYALGERYYRETWL